MGAAAEAKEAQLEPSLVGDVAGGTFDEDLSESETEGDLSQLFEQRWRHPVLLQHLTVAYAVAHILVHTWPPEPLADVTE